MAALFSSIARLFGAADFSPRYKTVEVYDSLRTQVLSLRPEQVGATHEDEVIALLMETGYSEAVATLVSVIDGAASLYFSTGGGIIGGGEHEKANAASKKLIRMAGLSLKHMKRAATSPLPKESFTRFYAVTRSGLFSAEVKEEDLGEGRSPLSPLFHTAHELITEIRIIDEQRSKNG